MQARIVSTRRVRVIDQCVGCGKFYVRLCPACSELQRLTLSRIAKLLGTLEWRFAELRYW